MFISMCLHVAFDFVSMFCIFVSAGWFYLLRPV